MKTRKFFEKRCVTQNNQVISIMMKENQLRIDNPIPGLYEAFLIRTTQLFLPPLSLCLPHPPHTCLFITDF